jgi:diacylglycerol kinase family enzyme
MDQVNHNLAKRVVARAANHDVALAVELDGELVGKLPVTFQVISRALRVRCPQT